MARSPARAHLLALLVKFGNDFAETVLDWCDLAEAEIHSWPQVADVGLTDSPRQYMESQIRSYERRAGRRTRAINNRDTDP
jgi:hypothetical protein